MIGSTSSDIIRLTQLARSRGKGVTSSCCCQHFFLELFTSAQFDRIPEPDLVMDSEEAVSAFARAGRPGGILSGVYAFYVEQACRMIRPGDRVLDLGCGAARLLGSVAALNEDVSFVGVDFSDSDGRDGKRITSSLASPQCRLAHRRHDGALFGRVWKHRRCFVVDGSAPSA